MVNQESELAKAMMLELLSGAFQMKHAMMTVWKRKQVNVTSYSWYEVSNPLKNPRIWTVIASTFDAIVYIEILDSFFFIPSIKDWFGEDEVIFRMISLLSQSK